MERFNILVTVKSVICYSNLCESIFKITYKVGQKMFTLSSLPTLETTFTIKINLKKVFSYHRN